MKSAFQILVTEFVMNSYIQLLCFDKKALFYSYKFFLTNDFEIHFPVANYFKFKKYMRLRSFITIGENYFFCYWKLERVFQKQLLNLLSSMTPFFVSIKKTVQNFYSMSYFTILSLFCIIILKHFNKSNATLKLVCFHKAIKTVKLSKLLQHCHQWKWWKI